MVGDGGLITSRVDDLLKCPVVVGVEVNVKE